MYKFEVYLININYTYSYTMMFNLDERFSKATDEQAFHQPGVTIIHLDTNKSYDMEIYKRFEYMGLGFSFMKMS